MKTKARYREQKRWFRKSVLVLQISYEIDYTGNDDVPPSRQNVQTRWRDAEVSDLKQFEIES